MSSVCQYNTSARRYQADRFTFPVAQLEGGGGFQAMFKRLQEEVNHTHTYAPSLLHEARRAVEEALFSPGKKPEDLVLAAHIAYGFSDASGVKVYGNEAQSINDNLRGDVGRLNAIPFHVMYRGWPYVFVMTDERVPAGAEIFMSYGEAFWKKHDYMMSTFAGTMDMVPVARS